MRTLIFGSIRPWAPFGGGMRARSISLALARLGAVDLVVLKYPTAPDDDPPLPHFDRVHAVRDRFDIAENRKLIAESLPPWALETDYDIVWFNQERVWLTAQGLVSGRPIVDVDDLQDVVLERWLAVGTKPDGTKLTDGDRQRMTAEIGYWRGIHQQVADQAHAIVFSSEHDRRRFGFGNSVVVPNTYEKTGTVTKHRSFTPTILYQGYMEWSTNEDAALWLAEEIVPRVRQTIPDVRLLLVGAPSARVKALDSEAWIDVIGEVPDMHPYLAYADLLVAPLRVAGGTRIKILEAFAHHIPVVTTPIGAEGLDVTHGVHLLLAEQADDLAAACVTLLQHRDAARQLAEHAHDLYRRAYRPERAFAAVEDAVQLATAGAARLPARPGHSG
ncbi:glycosyltransferase family 4 protein [Dactylosporangium sp. NPDC051485]|uniref:glycosyltransferase family 4 protein n=1 Tax=Dactylosporangium sp. NPDC051485 TaxID=3154846 RepID=UPI0034400204